MPDLFVAPDETKDTTIMHKRMPVDATQQPAQPNPPTSFAKPLEEPLQSSSVTQDPPVIELQTANDTSQNPSNKNISRPSAIPLFTAFWQNPTGIFFDTQEVNERILLFLRRHPITNLNWVLTTIVLALIAPIGLITASHYNHPLIILTGSFTFALIVFYYLLIATSAFLNFLNWYFNVSLITQERVLDIELDSLVGKKISATKISLVQDINYQQSGTLRSVFDYGDVLIQTASALDNFYIHAVPKPEVVVRVVEGLIGKSDEHV